MRRAEVTAFHRGLSDTSYVEGRDVAVEYRWAEGRYDRLPALAADLVDRQVSVIAAFGTAAALVAKATTTTIPIVFLVGGDPIALGLVVSLSRPGGSITGVTPLNDDLAPKLLEWLHELVPKAADIGYLVNPKNATSDNLSRQVRVAERTIGQRVHILHASSEHDFEPAFATLDQIRAGGLCVQGDTFFNGRREELVALAAHHSIPTVYAFRDYAAAGGLMSYGTSFRGAYRQVGVYAGRIRVSIRIWLHANESPPRSGLVVGQAALKPARDKRGREQDRKIDQGHDRIHLQRPIGLGVDQGCVVDEVRNGNDGHQRRVLQLCHGLVDVGRQHRFQRLR